MKAKAVVLIGAQGVAAEMRRVKSFGFQTLLLKHHLTLQESMQSDFTLDLSLHEESDVLDKMRHLANNYDICAVHSLEGSGLLLGARIKKALGIRHGLPAEAHVNLASAQRTRQFLAEYGVRMPEHAYIRSPLGSLSALKHVTLPAVVRVSDSDEPASVRCTEPAEVWATVEELFRLYPNSSAQWVLEEAPDASEHIVVTSTLRGRTTLLAATPPLPDDQADTVQRLVRATMIALGLNDSVAQTTVRLQANGPCIVKVQPYVDPKIAAEQVVLPDRTCTLGDLALQLALGDRFAESVTILINEG